MGNATGKVITYQDARTYLATMEANERKRTGIRTLKVGWNDAQGYYLEVTLMELSHRTIDDPEWDIPGEYKQLTPSPSAHVFRFTTPELIMHETIVMAGEQ